MNVAAGARTDVGRIRTANEDAYLTQTPVFVVADGMGGHIAGDIASSTAVDTIAEHLDSASAADPQTLAQLVRDANSAIWSKAQSDAALSGMGTTCTLVFIDQHRAHIAHVGDSRAYRLRDHQLDRLTEDHTLVARMVKEGKLRAEDAERHPQRSIITRALGVDSDVSVDLVTVELAEGDRLLLCSDGLTSMIEEQDIAEVLVREADAQAAADVLVDLANDAGGEDNITCVVLDVREEGDPSGGASAAAAAPPSSPRRARTDTEPGEAGPVTSRGRRLRWLIPVLALVALAFAGYTAAGYALDNSWFVGLDENDRVAIYSGIPEDIAGWELKEKQEVTSIALSELPEFLRPNVQEGIKVTSLSEAHETVDNLNDRARDFATDGAGKRERKN